MGNIERSPSNVTTSNDIKPNDIKPNDIKPNDIKPNDIKSNNTRSLVQYTQEHEYFVKELDKIGVILEEIIYVKPTYLGVNFNFDNSPISMYQIIGQTVKIISQLNPMGSSYYHLFDFSGKAEKIVGQTENDLIKALNFLILKPIQEIRIIYYEKILPSNRGSTISIEEDLIRSKLLMRQLECNIYKFLAIHSIFLDKMKANLDYVLGLFHSKKLIIPVEMTNSRVNIPDLVPDFRSRIYQSVQDPHNYHVPEMDDPDKLSKTKMIVDNEPNLLINNY